MNEKAKKPDAYVAWHPIIGIDVQTISLLPEHAKEKHHKIRIGLKKGFSEDWKIRPFIFLLLEEGQQ